MCVTATLVDGIVLARSAFHHSMNYRSVVILAEARVVTDPSEKLTVLAALVNRFSPGRSDQARAPNALELKATQVLALPIAEASAKIRTGGPIDAADDLHLPLWAGVVPLRLQALEPIVAQPEAAGHAVPTLGLGLGVAPRT